ncbi:hypothetical protein P43SY_006745 [Pythium insidiosum]|uniref:Tc1-like transposase DDE domain-containing protein n=1 Tax=Pythium insidiosum TaxID=114742 RepID=A0AAD5MBI5_PYTIN|nr:hypothetical protein P43SY_006745 [Pythium insidiosum]
MGERINAAQLPRLREEVCVDTVLQNLEIRESRVAVAEAKRQKQREVAQAQATERGRNQLQEMARACLHSNLVEQRMLKRMREREQRHADDSAVIDQLEIAQATWERCTVFLRKAFGVEVSMSTVRARVKDVCGFRHGDFRRFPRDRNSSAAIEARHQYAMKGGNRQTREAALYEAIYFDEMYLTKNTKTGAWTVIGWTPTGVEETPHENNGIQLSLLLAHLAMEYLPQYSPFLSPIEEVFGLVKRTLWKRRREADRTDEDRHFLKKRLTEVILDFDEALIKTFYGHVAEFLKNACERTPVSTQQLYESSHIGDEIGACPMLPEHIELLLNSYLPHVYDEFTAENQALIEQQFGVKRLTLPFVEDVILPDRSAALEDAEHTFRIA